VVKYNPLAIVNTSRPQTNPSNYFWNSNEGQQMVEPILYDPLSKKTIQQTQIMQRLNHADPGSLLKVWTGKLDLVRYGKQLLDIECYTT
jgi:hypothetical protein